ncbi:MAG: VIT1/CCC1 transporter family protein [Promethearchaeota archaeon]
MKERINQFISSDKGDSFKNFVFGFQDGLISTYALLIGIAVLVLLNPWLLVMALLAEVAAGALSMAFGAYVSTKTQNELSNDISIDELKKRGFNQEELQKIKIFSSKNKETWEKLINNYLHDTFPKDPINNAFLMAFAFILGGMLPVLPYFFPLPTWSFLIATILSFTGLFIIGIIRSLFTDKHWTKLAGEMILIGILAILIISIYLYFIQMTYGLFLLT